VSESLDSIFFPVTTVSDTPLQVTALITTLTPVGTAMQTGLMTPRSGSAKPPSSTSLGTGCVHFWTSGMSTYSSSCANSPFRTEFDTSTRVYTPTAAPTLYQTPNSDDPDGIDPPLNPFAVAVIAITVTIFGLVMITGFIWLHYWRKGKSQDREEAKRDRKLSDPTARRTIIGPTGPHSRQPQVRSLCDIDRMELG
jgi:hypothetical protein